MPYLKTLEYRILSETENINLFKYQEINRYRVRAMLTWNCELEC